MRISDWSSDVCSSDLAMLRFARLGWVGVNWHGGGNGHYSPIIGAPSTGFSRRPAFYGIQFAQLLTGATFVPATPPGASRFVTARSDERRVGKEGVSTCSSRRSPEHLKVTKHHH